MFLFTRVTGFTVGKKINQSYKIMCLTDKCDCIHKELIREPEYRTISKWTWNRNVEEREKKTKLFSNPGFAISTLSC